MIWLRSGSRQNHRQPCFCVHVPTNDSVTRHFDLFIASIELRVCTALCPIAPSSLQINFHWDTTWPEITEPSFWPSLETNGNKNSHLIMIRTRKLPLGLRSSWTHDARCSTKHITRCVQLTPLPLRSGLDSNCSKSQLHAKNQPKVQVNKSGETRKD